MYSRSIRGATVRFAGPHRGCVVRCSASCKGGVVRYSGLLMRAVVITQSVSHLQYFSLGVPGVRCILTGRAAQLHGEERHGVVKT